MHEIRARQTVLTYSSFPIHNNWTLQTYQKRDGVGVVDWRNKLKKCIDASSTYSRTNLRIVEVVNGSWYVDSFGLPFNNPPIPPYVGIGSGLVAMTQTFADPALYVPADALNSARSKFVQKALASQRLFNGLDVLGQLRQTIHDIKHPVSALRKGLSSYLSLVKERAHKASRGRRSAGTAGIDARRRSVASAIQGTWLEYVYGWIPNLQDAQGAVHAAAHLVDPDLPVRQNISSHASFAYYVNALYGKNTSAVTGIMFSNSNGTGSLSQIDVQRIVHAEGTVRFSGAVRCLTPGHDRVKLLGFSLRDVVPTIWDLIPYSFLVDYFVNVSDILDALSFNVSDLAYGNMAVKVSLMEKFNTLPIAPFYAGPVDIRTVRTDSAASFTLENMNYTRSPIVGSTLIPSLQFSLPSVRQDFNIAALVAQHSSVVNFIAKLL
jgi:hypothetical protein